MTQADSNTSRILFFDGVCALCSASVNFIMDHDPQGKIAIAPLQSELGQAYLARLGMPMTELSTMIFADEDKVYFRSDAFLRIVRYLSGAWPLLQVLRLVPAFIRNALYDVVARNRYRWFGRYDVCRLPQPGQEKRFLSGHQ